MARPTLDEMKLVRDHRLSYGYAPPKQMSPPAQASYIGRKGCGCAVTWCSGRLPMGEITRELRRWERQGLTIERVSVEYARENLTTCSCTPAPEEPHG